MLDFTDNRKPVYNAEYRRAQYIKHREKILQKQKEYDDQHRDEINRKARARYRAKCGIEILKEKCNNCESSYREHGKLCPWRSISGDYCFDGMNTKEAHREIKKNFNDFQTKIARGLVEK